MTMRLFPILVPPDVAERAAIGDILIGQSMTIVCAIPWSLIEPHEKRAKRNHRKGLEEIALRGGLDASEAICVIEDKPLFGKHYLPWRAANAKLAQMLVGEPEDELTAA
jgi:hypothetical protein